jgi:hypothetical protein
MAIPEEYKIIRKVGFSKPNIAYLLSRYVFDDKVYFFSCSHPVSIPPDSERLVLVYQP